MYKLSTAVGTIIGRHSTRISPRHVLVRTTDMFKDKLNGQLSSTLIQSTARTIYTEQDLGLDLFDRMRRKSGPMYEQRYLERLKTFLDNDQTNSLYLQDLETLIKLAQTDDHLDMIDRLMETFRVHPDVSEEQLGRFTPQVYKLYYHLGRTDRALKNLMDTERFGPSYQQPFPYKCVMTMLYNDQRYEEIIKLYEVSREKLNIDYSGRALSTLALAAYAKINTLEAFEEARKLAEQSRSISLQQKNILSYLALNNDHPVYALNQQFMSPKYLVPFSIRIMAMLRLRRYDDVRSDISLVEGKHILCRDVYHEIERCIDSIDEAHLKEDQRDLLRSITDQGLVSEHSLESAVFSRYRQDATQSEGDESDPREPKGRYERPEGRIRQRQTRDFDDQDEMDDSDRIHRPGRPRRQYNQNRYAPRFGETRGYGPNSSDQDDRYQPGRKYQY